MQTADAGISGGIGDDEEMMDYRQMQELQEQREQEAMSALVKIAFNGNEREAETLAAQLGLYHQFKQEINNEQIESN